MIRISGTTAMAAASALAGDLPRPRRAALRVLRDEAGDPLDHALVLAFPAPRSATGEDLVELHCHGGRAVIDAVESALLRHPGVRRAAPGEFTRRALTNGRIDLVEAEGLADLLEAETEGQRRAALAAAEGRVSRAVRGWMDRVADLSARVEASIDYAEEGDVEAEARSIAAVAADRRTLAADIALVLAAPPVERWRDGIRVVVAGPPNAGKSTLINALAAREAAIVSPIAGTTRDRIEVPVRRGGVAYVLVDTAGLRDTTDDPIERIGIDLTREAMRGADVTLWLGDEPAEPGGAVIDVVAKADLPGRAKPGGIRVSSFDPASVERLWEAIDATAKPLLVQGDGLGLHRRVWEACGIARDALTGEMPDPVIEAEQLRIARRSLAAALGSDATELMLDALFTRFCVGK